MAPMGCIGGGGSAHILIDYGFIRNYPKRRSMYSTIHVLEYLTHVEYFIRYACLAPWLRVGIIF